MAKNSIYKINLFLFRSFERCALSKRIHLFRKKVQRRREVILFSSTHTQTQNTLELSYGILQSYAVNTMNRLDLPHLRFLSFLFVYYYSNLQVFFLNKFLADISIANRLTMKLCTCADISIWTFISILTVYRVFLFVFVVVVVVVKFN